MTDKEKKGIFTLIAIMVIILIVVVCIKAFGNGGSSNTTINKQSTTTNVANQDDEKYTTELNDGTKLNNSSDLKKSKTYKTVEISDIQITSKNGNTTILANVKNTGTTEFASEDVKLRLIGEDGEVITTVPVTIPKTAVGETTQINTIVTADIANVKDFTIEAK